MNTSARLKRYTQVGLFVDWNAQLRLVPAEFETAPVDRCRIALARVGKQVAKKLTSLNDTNVYRVRTRIYHGWTTGLQQTQNRLAFAKLNSADDPDSIFPSTRVLALSGIEFGDRLIDALPERENVGLSIHLPNTARRQSGDKRLVEKMVDTALCCDLLSWAKAEPTSIALVISPDDDMVPPVFVAEAWMKPLGGSVILFRSAAGGDSKFLSLNGLLA